MPIQAQTIVTQMAAALDAEGNDYYKWERDYRQSLHYAVDQMCHFINTNMGSNRFSMEAKRELTKTVVYQTNAYSRIAIQDEIFGIIAVLPEPQMLPANPTVTVVADDQSVKRTDIAYLGGVMNAEMYNEDEFYEQANNPFSKVFGLETRNIRSYGYLPFQDFSATGYAPNAIYELTIKPNISKGFVAITQLLIPTKPTLITDNLQFPKSLMNILENIALLHIAIKQGDQTNVYGIAMRDIVEQIKQYQ
jgi:hypothetical protein